jgi:hypothetical protein
MSVDGMFVYWWKAFGVHVLALVGNSFCCVMLPLCEDSSLLIGYRWVVRMVGGKKRGRKGNCFGHIRFCAGYRRSLKYNERRCFIKVDSSLLPFLCLFFPSSPLFFLSVDFDTAPQTAHTLYNILERRTQGNSLPPAVLSIFLSMANICFIALLLHYF